MIKEIEKLKNIKESLMKYLCENFIVNFCSKFCAMAKLDVLKVIYD